MTSRSHSPSGRALGREDGQLRDETMKSPTPTNTLITRLEAASGDIRVGKWTIHFDPPPIPFRDLDWAFHHDDYDASWEGEEDGWVSNGLAGRAESIEACKAAIAEIEEDRADAR